MSKPFEELLKALNEASDETAAIAAAPAAADEGMNPEDDDEDADGADDAAIAAAAAEAGGREFGKSFEFVDETGAKHEAVDATELVKSLMERQEKTDDVLAKALGTLTGTMKAQGDLIKSLTTQVQTLSAQGRGRKTVLNIAEKPDLGTMAKSHAPQEQGMSVTDFFAKANNAFDTGRISGKELNIISVSLRGNHPVDESLISKVVSA